MNSLLRTVVLVVPLVLTSIAQAQLSTIAQWGIPDRAGDIVTSTQFLVPPIDAPTGWTTYTPGNENNPVVGAGYYPNSAGRTPVFNVAFSGLPNTGQLDVFQPGNPAVTNDQIRLPVNDGETQARGMIVFENLLSGTSDPLATFTAEVYQFQGNPGEGVMRFLFQDSNNNWYASDPSEALPGGFQTREITNAPAANWYEFTPFDNGVSSIAESPSAGIDFTNVQAVGAYWDIAKGAGNNALFSLGYLQATTGTLSTAGDFDGDDDVDGHDFLEWQVTDGTAGGLMEWRDAYPAAPLATVNAVPEPSGAAVLTLMTIAGVATRWRRR